MSKYTTELRYICEYEAGLDESTGYLGVGEVISKARPKVFSFTYPIFDESYKPVLETKILKHYYTREIGEEVYGLWKLRLDMRMNEIMPLYNKMYEAYRLEFNPLHDTDYTETKEANATENKNRTIERRSEVDETVTNESKNESTSQGSTTSHGTDSTTDKYSDTPQGALTGFKDDRYLTNARLVNGSNDNTGSSTGSSTSEDTGSTVTDGTTTENTSDGLVGTETSDYVIRVIGRRNGGNMGKVLREYIDSLENIDMRIIRDLGDLFMNLW